MRGILVCIEGIDGAGKNTQTKMLSKRLADEGIVSVVYSYPDYNSPYGAIIKNFLERKIELSVEELFFLHILDKQKDREKIRKDLEKGRVVIADRYVLSAITYQTAGGFNYESAKAIAALSKLPKPDAIFYLDVPVSVSVERKGRQKGSLDRFEAASAYLNKVRGVYNKLYRERFDSENWTRIDGRAEPGVVHEEIFLEVSKLLDLKN